MLTRKGAAILTGIVVGASAALGSVAFAYSEPTDAPADYYNGTEGLTGDELKSVLHDIIDGHTALSYSQVKTAIADTDADPNNPANIILMYSGVSEPYSSGSWNREHTWAKSHGDFGTAVGPGTDLHHLRPTLIDVNSRRSNLDFDNGGQEVPNAPGNYYDGDSFEPRDEVKGDVARMLFYMAVRWEGDDSFADLELNEQVNNGKAPYHGKLSVLMEWSQQDPPDAFEKNRNDVIFDYQNNRNPFIDHPEWVNAIWGDGQNPDPGPDPDPDPTDPPPATCDATSSGAVTLKDNGITATDIAISGCDADSLANSSVTVDITHPDQGELSLYLYAPDGSYYVLKRNGGSGADITETYSVDLSGETANGTWTLSVKDYASGNTGTINEWAVSLS